MSSLVLIILSVSFFVSCTELSAGESNQNAREEKLRSALFDAFQSIKKASAKGGIDDESPLTSDLDMISTVDPTRSDKLLHVDKFDLSGDDGGLTFADAFDTDERTEERKVSSTEKSHNVQHIVKTTVRVERTTGRPQGRDVLSKLSATIRSAVNESKGDARRESRDNGSEAVGSEALGSDLTKEGLGGEVRGIEEVLRVFDAALLLRQWPRLQRALSAACRTDMELYVRALTRNTLWAYKMEDASGRYTTMFYWGNNYWTGSAELCRALNNHLPPSRLHNRSSGSQIFSAWREDVSMTGSGPPFETAFYTVRLLVSSDHPDIVKSRRTMHLGVCLPYSCGRAGVTTLVSAVQAPFLNHSVLGVRSPDHEEYTYMEDPTVHVLLAVASLVTILLIAATVYDFKLSQEVRRRRRRVVNMAASESGASDTKLDLNGLEAITVAKDKSMYNCNNNIANLSEERLTGETASTDEELKLSIWSELLLSFSVKANTLQIFDQSVGADTIPVVHGLRMMSMVWVIFGHTCIVMFKYADNTALRAILEKSFWFQLIISAVYSVDTFFCLGGMLVTFLYFRTSAKGKLDRLTKGRRKLTSGVLQFLGLMAYRFARLTAPYLFMLGVVQVTMKWFAVNSVFEPPANDHETCPQYWWRNLLYINTLFPVEQMCMLWSWYLSDDTQFYAVSAILLILATSHFKLSVSLTGVFFISSLFTTGYVSYSTEHIPNSEDPFTQFDKIYDKPWTRLGPYLVGMATGWILFKTNLKIRMPKMLAWLGWVVCTATFLFLIFGLYRTELGVGAAAVYSAVSHSLWAACVGWVIIACSTGHGGWVKHILSAPVLYPFSRVTYCTYLVHPVVLRYVAMHLTHPVHLAEILVFVLFLGLTVISYVIAFVVSLAFEAPMVSMLKILSPQRKPHRV